MPHADDPWTRPEDIDRAIAEAEWTIEGLEYLLGERPGSPADPDVPEQARPLLGMSAPSLELILRELRVRVEYLEVRRAALGGDAG